MTLFSIAKLQKSSAWAMFRMKDRIKMDPDYQRQGEIWTRDKRQLLVDTMINGFDVPKLYLHKFSPPIVEGDSTFEYAMIDGKQRAEAIFSFVENRYALESDFKYLADEDVDLGGLTYRELATEFPDIKQDFDSFTLDVVTIETDDTEIIEDLFSRLNEAMPLNAPEKRNAKPGPLPKMIRDIAKRKFFTEKLPFTNSRYRHFDIAAKMMLTSSRYTVLDTKKAYLDRYFADHAESTVADVKETEDTVISVLDAMADVFTDKDVLLRSVGMISLYYLLFEAACKSDQLDLMVRSEFVDFEDARFENRKEAEEDISEASYRLLEFDRYAQSPNDGIALRYRLAVIDDHIYGGKMGFADDSVLEK
jgi:hypothetical protein